MFIRPFTRASLVLGFFFFAPRGFAFCLESPRSCTAVELRSLLGDGEFRIRSLAQEVIEGRLRARDWEMVEVLLRFWPRDLEIRRRTEAILAARMPLLWRGVLRTAVDALISRVVTESDLEIAECLQRQYIRRAAERNYILFEHPDRLSRNYFRSWKISVFKNCSLTFLAEEERDTFSVRSSDQKLYSIFTYVHTFSLHGQGEAASLSVQQLLPPSLIQAFNINDRGAPLSILRQQPGEATWSIRSNDGRLFLDYTSIGDGEDSRAYSFQVRQNILDFLSAIPQLQKQMRWIMAATDWITMEAVRPRAILIRR